MLANVCPVPTFLPQRRVYHKFKPQHGCHLPPGGAPDISFLLYTLKHKLFLAVLGAVDINCQIEMLCSSYWESNPGKAAGL